MNVQVSVPDWLKLDHSTRVKLSEIFKIPRSKGAMMEMSGSVSVMRSDGHTHEDLAAITLEGLQKYLGSESDDFVVLFNTAVAKIEEDKELEIKESIPDPSQLMIDEWVAVFQRLKGQAAEKNMQPHLVEVVKRVFEIKPDQHAQVSSAQPNARVPAKRQQKKAK